MAVTISIVADSSQANEALRQLQASVNQSLGSVDTRLQQTQRTTESATARMARSFEQLNRQVQSMLAAFGVGAGIAGLVQFTRSIVDAGVTMERFERTLIAATGSLGEARSAFEFIVTESNRLGQSIQGMIPAFAQLAAATRSTALEGERTRALFSSLVGAGRAVGLSTEATGRAMIGLIQIISQNAIQLDEFRNQFSSQIPGAMRETARALGEMGVTLTGSTSEMLDMISRQRLSVEDLIQAVTTGLQEIQRTAPDMSDTAEAAFQRFSNALFQLKADVARSGLLDALKEIVDFMNDSLQGFARMTNLQNTSLELQRGQLINQIVELQREQARLQETVTGGPFSLSAERAAARARQIDQEVAQLRQRIAGINAEIEQAQARERELARQNQDRLRQEQEELRRFDEQRRAMQAAPERLKGEEAALAASLKRQESLIAASFDQRRQLEDQAFAERLRQEPLRVEELERERHARLRALTIEEARMLQDIRVGAAEQQLAAALRTLDAEAAVTSGKADELAKIEARKIVVRAQTATEIERILAQTAAVETRLSEETLAQQIKDAEALVRVHEQVNAQIERRDQQMFEARRREVERQLEREQRAYEQFVDRVTDRIANVFEGILTGTLDLLEGFRQLFLRTIAQLAAEAIARPIVVPIIAGVIGGVASGFGASAAGAVGNLLGADAAGLVGAGGMAGNIAGILGTIFRPIAQGFQGLQVLMIDALEAVRTATVGWNQSAAALARPTFAEALSFFGGIAGIGGGIFSALTATNTTSMGFGAAGAAAGLTATLASLAVLPAILGPIGLALSALLPLIGGLFSGHGPGVFLQTPRLATGAGITTTPEGQLAFTGGLEVEGRARQVDAQPVQDALTQALTQSINAMVEVINAIALDPAALQDVTQQALEDTLQRVIRLNSANRDRMSQELADQARLAQQQMIAGMFIPLIAAFQQLDTASLEEQRDRLPQTVGALVAVLTGMNQSFAELSQSANSDVQNRLQELRDQIDAFAAAIVDTTAAIARTMVTTIETELTTTLPALLEASIQTQLFALGERLQEAIPTLAILRQTEQMLAQAQLDTTAVRAEIDRLSALIVDDMTAIASDLTTTLTESLAATLPTVLSTAIEAQAAVVASRLTEALQVLSGLQTIQVQLGAAGLETSAIEAQIAQLTETIITDSLTIIADALSEGARAFDDALRVILAIPPELAALDPALQQLQAMAQQFAGVVIPLGQQIAALEAATRPLSVTVADTVSSISSLEAQIAQAGDNISVVLPLYEQLAQAILQQAAVAQQVANELLSVQQTMIDALVVAAEDLGGTAAALQLRFDLLIPQLEADLIRAIEGGPTPAELDALATSAEELIRLGQDAVVYARQLADEAERLRSESAQAAQQAENAQDRLMQLEEEWKALEERYMEESLDALREQVRVAEEAASQAEQAATRNQQQLDRVMQTLRTEATPAEQLALIEAQLAPLEASLAAGSITPDQMDQLIGLNEELIALGQETNRLDLVAAGMENLLTAETYLATMQPQLDSQAEALRLQADALAAQLATLEAQQEAARAAREQADLAAEQARIQAEMAQAQADIVFYQQEAARLAAEADAKAAEANYYFQQGYTLQQLGYDLLNEINLVLQSQLLALTGTTDATMALISIESQSLAALQQIQLALFELYRLEYYALTGQVLTFQRGGLVHAQQGRMIMAEPGEMVYSPQSRADTAALARVNAMIPRFQVGGSGEGDSVPLWVPSGSFVLNRTASRAVSGGYQSGGMVGGSQGSGGGVTITVDLRGASFRSVEDGRQIVELLRRELRQIGGDLGTYLGMRR